MTNIATASPEDVKWLATHRCKHGHAFTSHFNCYLKEHQVEERIGALDIEAGGLKANVDIMLSWAIKTVGQDEIWYDYVTSEELRNGDYDKRIVESCIQTMLKYDRLVGHYSTYFDIPYIRSRALVHRIPFPEYGRLYHSDVWKMARRCLCLSSNRQDTVAETILDENIKTRVNFRYWLDAKYGSDKARKKALQYIVDHNLKDVQQLEDNYLKLRPFVRENRSSI